MNYVYHDFYHNFTQSGVKNQHDISIQLFSQEITDLILRNPSKVLGVFKLCGIKYSDKWSYKEIIDAVYDNLKKNTKFLKAIAFLISENSGVITGNINDQTKTSTSSNQPARRRGEVGKTVPRNQPVKKKSSQNNSKSWFQRVNDVEIVLEDMIKQISDDPSSLQRAKKETFEMLVSKSSSFQENIDRRFEPEDRGVKIFKFLVVAGAIAFVLYKLYQWLPSESDLDKMGDGGNLAPDQGSGKILNQQRR